MKLTAKQIESLVKQGEVVHTECKDASGGLPDSLWESYSSFANTDGGVILLGVKEVDHEFSISGVPKASTLIKQFWDGVNNREKVNVNILFDRHVYSVKCRGRDVVVIEVPRADRRERPVCVGRDVFNGTYRRNGEGDYKCLREAVLAMLRDAGDVTADATVLKSLSVADLNGDSIRHYREEFARFRPRLAWNKLSDDEFLKKIGAMDRGDDGILHPNARSSTLKRPSYGLLQNPLDLSRAMPVQNPYKSPLGAKRMPVQNPYRTRAKIRRNPYMARRHILMS